MMADDWPILGRKHQLEKMHSYCSFQWNFTYPDKADVWVATRISNIMYVVIIGRGFV